MNAADTAPTATVAPAVAAIPVSAASQASIAAYLASGDRMSDRMQLGWKLCLAAMALVALAWVMGLLPIALRLF